MNGFFLILKLKVKIIFCYFSILNTINTFMKTYELDTFITFGKYEGITLKQIFEKDPDYILWCCEFLEHFYISEQTIENLKNFNSTLSIPERVIEILDKKYDDWIDNDWNERMQERERSREWYNEANSWDNEYYNDSLDMDQQSQEFWDNL